ncbi:MAG: amidohydrolase family protein, partial [Porticoccaceae bacterium]|nr:amidohydrolase family protein [Porticoccaceae bacterium]
MRRLTDIRLAILLPLLMLSGCNEAPQADIAFYGDNIITLSEQSESANFVAVKDDTIVFVGQRDDWDGQTTEVVNLEDSALLPGFIDAHGHVAWHGRLSAMANIASPPVGPAEDMNGLVMALKSHIASKDLAEGDWVVGMGYDDSL